MLLKNVQAMGDTIKITNASENNLKHVSLEIPRDKLVVVTGLSGSGKSSLAFDTVYAEGRRRYMETLSAYARQFMGILERPSVENISGLSPVIAIEQKSTNRNPRSTVGTITEIYDFFRLLYARAARAYSPVTGKEMARYTDPMIVDLIMKEYAGKKTILLAPIVKGRKGHYRELFDNLLKKGFTSVRVDGKICQLADIKPLDRYKAHFIELVIDKVVPSPSDEKRIRESVELALSQGKGVMAAMVQDEAAGNSGSREYASLPGGAGHAGGASAGGGPLEGNGTAASGPDRRPEAGTGKPADSDGQDERKKYFMSGFSVSGGLRYFSRHLMCPDSGISFGEPAPHLFSFNSPQGACPYCKGLGRISEIDLKKIIPDDRVSIADGGIKAIGCRRDNNTFRVLEAIARKYGFSLGDPISSLPEEALNLIIYGSEELFRVNDGFGFQMVTFPGIIAKIEGQKDTEESYDWREAYSNEKICPECHGARLNNEALCFKIAGKNIAEISAMDIKSLYGWVLGLPAELNERENIIAADILKEIRERLTFLLEVGLDYLSLDRAARSLSGGESQRIRLATQIGSKLVNVLYILDEPSIGLHQRDNTRLINSLRHLCSESNSVMVVEHDEDMIRAADWLVDLGPGAGASGGKVLFSGKPSELMAMPESKVRQLGSLTAEYLKGMRRIEVPSERRKGNGKFIELKGASGNNLKDVDVRIPLGMLVGVSGVSGSGKSSLINETLMQILSKHFYRSNYTPLPYREIIGLENIDKLIEIDQTPIGRSPRSNPATYTGVFSDIRKLFEETPDAKIRGFKSGRFSFNVRGGRCEACKGVGMKEIEMNFLPSVLVRCEECGGKRYKPDTLAVRYKGKNINDVLEMTISEATEFFKPVPSIYARLKALDDVGLGYIKLGHPATALSGGESQRVKLAGELARKSTGNTLYILDEPTTGLHFEDIRILLDVLQKIVDQGNTVIVIEHNMDVLKSVDYLIDMGPEGGCRGGRIIAEGTPEEVACSKDSYTAEYLRKVL